MSIAFPNLYYETFYRFRNACGDFFRHPHPYQVELRSLMAENGELDR